MKKIYSLLIGLFLAFSVIGQTYLTEDFSSGRNAASRLDYFRFYPAIR